MLPPPPTRPATTGGRSTGLSADRVGRVASGCLPVRTLNPYPPGLIPCRARSPGRILDPGAEIDAAGGDSLGLSHPSVDGRHHVGCRRVVQEMRARLVRDRMALANVLVHGRSAADTCG